MDTVLSGNDDSGGQFDRVQGMGPDDWAAIDEALGRFTAASVIPLLGAAIDAPWSRPWQHHLTLLWLRAVGVPPAGSRPATDPDLAVLVNAAVEVARYPVLPPGVSNDPRHPVGFMVAGRRWRIHPGDYLYPLMLLRRLAATAQAVDSTLLDAVGFTLTDVIEVVLAHGDDILKGLAEAWSASADDTTGTDAGRTAARATAVSTAEVDAVRESMARLGDPRRITNRCSRPERATGALTWLTRDAVLVTLADTPGLPTLGPVLRVRSGDAVFPIPASLTLDALNAAADILVRHPEIGDADAVRLQALTCGHAFAVFNKRLVNRVAPMEIDLDIPPIITGPRTVATVVSALSPDMFTAAIERATDVLDRRQVETDTWHVLGDLPAPATTSIRVDHLAKVIVYGGPLVINWHQVRDVILLHIEELVELVDAAGGDWATVECFLQDLGEHAGHDVVFFQDILDVWTAWRDWGRIGPPADQDDTSPADQTRPGEDAGEDADEQTALHVVAAEYDATWVQAAGWEAIDTVLATAALPEHRDWPIATIDADDTANLFTTPHGEIALVSTDPALVILIDGSDAATLNLDADMYFQLADAVRYCITRRDDIASHFRLHDTPLTIVLGLTDDPAPDLSRGYGLRVACAAEPAVLSVIIGPDVLELLHTDPMTGHNVLGGTLHELVRRIRVDRAADPGTSAETFRNAWEQVGPLMMLNAVADSRPTAAPVDTLPRTPAIRARALRAVADRLCHRVAPGTYSDTHAHTLCQDTILPTIEETLSERIAACDPSLLYKLAVRLNAAYATYLRRSHQIMHSLAGPWAANWHDAARDGDRSATMTSLQTLFEAALADPPVGTRTVDALDLGELAALAELLALAAAADYGYERDLHGLQVDINDDGIFVVQNMPVIADQRDSSSDPPLDIDLAAYHRAQLDHLIAVAATDPWTIDDLAHQASQEGSRFPHPGQQRDRVPFQQLATFAEPSLLQADALLARGWGTGLDGLAAVLGTAADWPTDENGIAAVNPDDLTGEATDWSTLPDTQIRAALHLLQIDPVELQQGGARRFLNVEQRSHRLLTRPLPMIDGRILVMPWLIHAALQLHNNYLAAARLPHPVNVLPPGVADAMNKHRKSRNDELETTVRDVAADLGLPHRFQFNQSEQARLGIPNPVGEIDVLITDPANSRLWICEVKDLATPHSVAAMRHHVRQFTHGKRFVPKLLEKAEQIQRHAHAVALACGVTEMHPWRVIPLIVTRHVEPAAYVQNPKVAFTLPYQLREVLQNPIDPVEGPAPASHPS
ncbi:hypothetical protein [Actinoplanes sp. NPDC026619]|uniref:hypothetical protein n=1 Tax=Actinoplanes sp. NPDC026619 TaxID=3155798 RepID=UPI0033FA47F2